MEFCLCSQHVEKIVILTHTRYCFLCSYLGRRRPPHPYTPLPIFLKFAVNYFMNIFTLIYVYCTEAHRRNCKGKIRKGKLNTYINRKTKGGGVLLYPSWRYTNNWNIFFIYIFLILSFNIKFIKDHIL
jgi:hypothetical protein